MSYNCITLPIAQACKPRYSVDKWQNPNKLNGNMRY